MPPNAFLLPKQKQQSSLLPSSLLSLSLLPFISANPVWQGVGVSKWFQVRGGFRNETVIDHRSSFPSRETLSSVSFRGAGDKLYPSLDQTCYPHRRRTDAPPFNSFPFATLWLLRPLAKLLSSLRHWFKKRC